MLFCRFLKKSLNRSQFPTIYHHFTQPLSPLLFYTQKFTYVDVYMKWKRDEYYESIDHIHESIVLKPLIALKNCIAEDPTGRIPVSAVSKRGLELGLKMKVARFLRLYPSFFEEFTGPQYNHPWFKLTPEAILIDQEERAGHETFAPDLRSRLKKLVLMSREKVLPLKIVQGMLWYLGLPEDFVKNPEANLDESFRIVDLEDGFKGLKVVDEEKVLSTLQRNAMRKGVWSEGSKEGLPFPLFPSKGLRLRRKIENWLAEFQELPYLSPYEEFSDLNPCSDVSEKRVVGVLHELLSLFVEHAAERKKLLCLKKYLGLPQKFHKAFERHPHVFYLSFKKKTCTAILKEPYNDKSAIQRHPLLKVRKKYIRLMKESGKILRSRRTNNKFCGSEIVDLDLDLDFGGGDGSQTAV